MDWNTVSMYFYESLLGTRRSAIGQSFPLSLETVSEVFAEVTSVLDNMRPPLIKTFFFSVTSIKPLLRSHPLCLSNKCRNNKQKLQIKVNVGGNVPIRFHPPISMFLLHLEAP